MTIPAGDYFFFPAFCFFFFKGYYIILFYFLPGEGGTKLAKREHGVFHGTSSEGALAATFSENGEGGDWWSLQVCTHALQIIYFFVRVKIVRALSHVVRATCLI